MLSVSLKRTPNEAIEILRAGNDARYVAHALEINEGQLLYILYNPNNSSNYRSFSIPKKRGGSRLISAPGKSINILQKKLLYILSSVYEAPSWVHGFVLGRSVLTNANEHTKKKYVVNIDLEDFYGSIHFGRIRGALQSAPWKFSLKVATVLAQLLTFDRKLPQGACTSPLVSNIVAWGLDRKMLALSRKYKMKYTRYADDLTLSTTHKSLSGNIATWDVPNPTSGKTIPGKELRQAVEDSGFRINEKKFRIQIPETRQEVTGLTVNEFPNVQRIFIRKIRALLHSWRVNGLIEAETRHINEYAKAPPKIPKEKRDGAYFKQVVYGYLAYIKQIRNDNDRIYLRLCGDVALLDEKPPKFITQGKDKLNMYDFFICHASEDKENIARPLYDALTAKGKKAFLDEKYLKVGDSFVKMINQAMGRSKYLVAIISKNSYKKAWPISELSSALAMDISRGKKILPVMVGNSSDISQYLDELPLLSDRLYYPWDGDSVKAADVLINALP